MVALTDPARLSSRSKTCRKIESDVETQIIRWNRQLRSGPAAVRRGGADRRRRSGVHDLAAGGNFLPRLSHHGFRYLRAVEVKLHRQEAEGHKPLCGVPAFVSRAFRHN